MTGIQNINSAPSELSNEHALQVVRTTIEERIIPSTLRRRGWWNDIMPIFGSTLRNWDRVCYGFRTLAALVGFWSNKGKWHQRTEVVLGNDVGGESNICHTFRIVGIWRNRTAYPFSGSFVQIPTRP